MFVRKDYVARGLPKTAKFVRKVYERCPAQELVRKAYKPIELVRKVYEPTISNLPGRERRQGREGVGGCSTAGKLRKQFWKGGMDALRGDAENGILGFTVTITGKLTVNHRYGLEVWGVLLKALQSGSRLELGARAVTLCSMHRRIGLCAPQEGPQTPWEQVMAQEGVEGLVGACERLTSFLGQQRRGLFGAELGP
jgi:hypothetical protein